MAGGHNIVEMQGRTFGYLAVIERAGSYKRGNVTWRCRCTCGNEVVFSGQKLRKGERKSCGCMNAEAARAHNTTHGESGTRLFRIWTSMKTRCTNPSSSNWDRYGAHGVAICNEWLRDFATFSHWAKTNGYADNLSIDRFPNAAGNYEPGNCRWATRLEQRHNRRTS